MKPLKIAADLALPIEVVTEALAFLGRRGSGKTYAAQKLAEEMHRHQAQFVALDPVGIWYGLRLAADGKSPGLPVPVLGGLHGDIPLEATGGALIADLVVDRGVSVVIDVSQFESDAQKARFAQAFADRFFFRKKASPSAVHVFLEECQEFIPQNPQGEETRMLHAFNRMVKIGRNFGIGMSMISQRPQEVNKKSLNLAEILFAFQMTGPQERKTIEGWIADKGIDEDIAAELPKLERGEPHVWSPALLKISRRVRIEKKTTFDASSTPKVGKEAAQRELSPIDLDQLRTDMAATIEKAKADDPKLLRAENAKLRAELAKKTPVAGVSKSELAAEYTRGREDGVEVGRLKGRDEVLDRATGLYGPLKTATLALDALNQAANSLGALPPIPKASPLAPAVTGKASPPTSAHAVRARQPAAAASGNGTGGPLQRILNALAELELLGVEEPERVQVAFLAGYSNLTSKGFANSLGTARSEGLVTYPSDGRLALTDAGRERAVAPERPTSAEEVQGRLLRLLGGQYAKVLEPLIKVYPKAIERTELASEAGYTNLTSKGFANALGRLRSLGFIGYPTQGQVAALPVLFLEQ